MDNFFKSALWLLGVFVICLSQLVYAEHIPLPEDLVNDHRLPKQWVDTKTINLPQRLIIEYEYNAIDSLSKQELTDPIFKRWHKEIYLHRQQHKLHDLKNNSYQLLPSQLVYEYSHLPMSTIVVDDLQQLRTLLTSQNIKKIIVDQAMHRNLNESSALIQIPETVDLLSQTGSGTSIVVLDSGVEYNQQAFGNCTAPATPDSCRVLVAMDLAEDDGVLDDDGHGTNVAAIIAGIASDSDLIVMDVFDGELAFNSDIIAGINWAIANQTTYNITAINMSFGGTTKFTSPCSATFSNPYRTPVINAKAVGIISVASSGNESFLDGLVSPACTPEIISVGAVYDTNVGSVSYEFCSDNSTNADKVTCFSNVASFLDLLAPGAVINAGSYNFTGTSQAAPHVSALISILSSAYPNDTSDQTIQRIKNSADSVLDSRVGQSYPRINAWAAVGAINDRFTDPILIDQAQSQISIQTQSASKELNEPDHLGFTGGKSTWFKYHSNDASQVQLSTDGSSFDTVLAVYTGESLNSLNLVIENDDSLNTTTSELFFYATANTSYFIAVDDKNGFGGIQKLNYTITASSPEVIPSLPNIVCLIWMFIILLTLAIYSKQQFVSHQNK